MKLFVRDKKGSLSLSMEAIVILILAVVMLGLGLTFVRTMFSNITDKASNAIDVADLTAKPTEGEPITFSPSNPDVKIGKEAQVQVGFYNPSTSKEHWMMQVIDNAAGGIPCGGMNPGNGDQNCYNNHIETIYNNRPFTLEKDQMTGWNIVFKPGSDTVNDDQSSTPVLLTVKFCSVADSTATQCESDDEGVEIFQKELFMTVRQ